MGIMADPYYDPKLDRAYETEYQAAMEAGKWFRWDFGDQSVAATGQYDIIQHVVHSDGPHNIPLHLETTTAIGWVRQWFIWRGAKAERAYLVEPTDVA